MFSQRGKKNQGNRKFNSNKNGEDLVPVTYGRTIKEVDCYNCGKPGHMYFNINKPDRRRDINVKKIQVGYVFAQHNDK